MPVRMKKFGLIGFPLSHSFSKKYFTGRFINSGEEKKYAYENYEIENLDSLLDLIKSDKELQGLNVTIPFKEKIIALIDTLFYPATEIGAVNTIKIIRKGESIKLHGYNTDAIGFETAITPLLQVEHTGAMILGTGGASKAVAFVLQKMELPFIFISRQKNGEHITYRDITEDMVRKYPVIINTTPSGTFPLTSDAPPFPYGMLTPDNLLFDLVYNPAETLFMKKGLEFGTEVSNGYEMLVAQAEAAWKIWINE
jgi:shikimate dehydrogenase